MSPNNINVGALIISVIILIIVIVLIVVVIYNYNNNNKNSSQLIQNPKLAVAAAYKYKNQFHDKHIYGSIVADAENEIRQQYFSN